MGERERSTGREHILSVQSAVYKKKAEVDERERSTDREHSPQGGKARYATRRIDSRKEAEEGSVRGLVSQPTLHRHGRKKKRGRRRWSTSASAAQAETTFSQGEGSRAARQLARGATGAPCP